jgi:hypothetical protein
VHHGPRNAASTPYVVLREVLYLDEGDSMRADNAYSSQIEDLKSYFDHEEVNDEMDGDSPEYFTDGDSPAMLIGSRGAPKSRQDLLDLLPPKHVADRLVMRYFNAHSASQRTQATPRRPHIPSWSPRKALTAKVDRRCPQADI